MTNIFYLVICVVCIIGVPMTWSHNTYIRLSLTVTSTNWGV